MERSTLAAYAQQLQSCLQWDPLASSEGQDKRQFVEALTEIAALPLDSISMEIRRLLVASPVGNTSQALEDEEEQEETPFAIGDQPPMQQNVHLQNVMAALRARDVQLKCKAANAVGSLCISRVAGQQLLDLYGEEVLRSVGKMATCRNQWAQGDAFFVLGWIVVIADEDTLATIGQLLPSVVKGLHRNINLLDVDQEGVKDSQTNSARVALASSEQASNFRVYALVLLLNVSQRHVELLENLLDKLLKMLKDLVAKLLDSAPMSVADDMVTATTFFEPSEYAEVVRLAVTLLSVLVDQLESAAPLLLEMKMLPSLLKLKQVLSADQVDDDNGTQDVTERLEALVGTLLNSR
ncbi:hypothetical protein PHYBOEH_003618 [Phytophthora boehmeriae]|uniref:Uncharacterized protein n=1 Tax=Phytophthora boehmeriae TaxID=109152 RepID=A0A8T1WQ40_9STRA|nr:hypothetical protein PHYBOEH_003618 [Phytophthora boehmeriae]